MFINIFRPLSPNIAFSTFAFMALRAFLPKDLISAALIIYKKKRRSDQPRSLGFLSLARAAPCRRAIVSQGKIGFRFSFLKNLTSGEPHHSLCALARCGTEKK